MQKTKSDSAPTRLQKCSFLVRQMAASLVSLLVGAGFVAAFWPPPSGALAMTRFWAPVWLPLLYVLLDGWFAVKQLRRRLELGEPI